MRRSYQLSPGFHVQVMERPDAFVAVAKWQGGAAAVRVTFASIRRLIARLMSASARARQALASLLARITAGTQVGGAYVSDDLADIVVGGTTKAERMARRRRKRQERRKRVARRFKNSVKRVVRALAKLKILDKLRGVMRGIMRSKLASSALKLGAGAMGAAFGGPLGAKLGAGLAGGILGGQLESHGAKGQSAYAFGCGCK
jgi:hypothetical protein